MAIMKEEVFEAADAIEHAGEKVSSLRVRERLGTGSLTTITGHLKEWRKAQRDNAVQVEEIPQEIREAGIQFTRTVWTAASNWLRQELVTAKKISNSQVEEAEVQAQEAMMALESLEKERDELFKGNEALRHQYNERGTRVSVIEATISELRAELQNEREHSRELFSKLSTEGARAATLEERAKQIEERSQKLELEGQSLKSERFDSERRCQALLEKVTEITGRAERAEERLRQLEAK